MERMKRIALVALAVVLAVGTLGCGDVEPVETRRQIPPVTESAADDVYLTVEYGSVSSNGAVLVLTNLSHDYTFRYDHNYRLERFEEGGWISLHSDMAFADGLVSYQLDPLSEEVITAQWDRTYGALPSGEYRVVLRVGRCPAGADYEVESVGLDLYARFSL